MPARDLGRACYSAECVEQSEISENRCIRKDRARKPESENTEHPAPLGILPGVVLRNHDRRLRSAMCAPGDMRLGRIERGHCRSPYQAPPLKRPRLVAVYSGPRPTAVAN